MADRVGQQLGNYRITRLLGKGGFAEVYLGVHVHLGTEAAIKVLSTQLATAGDVEKFRQEARTIATLVHPNIIRVFDFDVVDGSPYLVMDYAPNGSLRQRFPQNTPLAPATFLPSLQQIAEALDYAHAHRFVHRDIKPENLLLGRQNEALLSDFGVATVAQTSSQQSTQNIAGTAAYMAPEQLQGHPRAASDLYSLGIIVYEWLTGERPFRGSFTEIASQHVLTPPPPLRTKVPGISPTLEQVVLTALAKDPKDRFSSVRAFATAVAQASQLPAMQPTLATQGGAFTYGTNQAPAALPGQPGVTIANAPTHVGSYGATANTAAQPNIVSSTISDAPTRAGAQTPPIWSDPPVTPASTPWAANTPHAGWPPPQQTFNFSAQPQAPERPAQPPASPRPSHPGRVALILVLALALILGGGGLAFGLVGKGPLSFLDARPTSTPPVTVTVTATTSVTPTVIVTPSATARPNQQVGVITEFGLATVNSGPAQITLGPDGALWFTENNGNKIGRITPNGDLNGFNVPTANSTPDGITLGPDGNLWFTENDGNQIGRITPGGSITEFPIPTTDSHPSGITKGSDGNIWFGEVTANKIGRITPGGSITEFNIPTPDGRPSGLTLGPDGNVWFVEIGAGKIGRITPGGNFAEFPLSNSNSMPNAITTGPDGNLWFVEGNANQIGRITPTGTITEFALPNANSVPIMIARGPDGNLWFTERLNNKMGRISPSGSITEFAVPTNGSRPLGIAPGPDQNIWFTEYVGNQIGRITTGR
ncbi:MAG TPA: protein kinase [Ktedonobacterales bacterium]|jgi:serine/threonine protein kinase/streptogramin lyase